MQKASIFKWFFSAAIIVGCAWTYSRQAVDDSLVFEEHTVMSNPPLVLTGSTPAAGKASEVYATEAAFHSDLLRVFLSVDGAAPAVVLASQENIPANYLNIVEPISWGADVSSGSYRYEARYSVSYMPVGFAVADTSHFFVLGHAFRGAGLGLKVDTSETIIESWVVSYTDGWPYTERLPKAGLIGQAAPNTAIYARIKDDAYKVPANRKDPTVVRRQIARLPFSSTCYSADPQGRYLLIVDPLKGELLQIAMVGPTAPDILVLTDATQHPVLTKLTGMKRFRGNDGVKRFLAVSSDSSNVLMLEDFNNDGVFLITSPLYSDYKSSVWGDIDQYEDDYLRYQVPLSFF